MARVDRLLSRREGGSAHDWETGVRRLREAPAGVARLEAMKGGLDVAELDWLAKDTFVEWVAETMLDAAREGAVLIEIRLGSGWATWPNLMSKFREAEGLAQGNYPNFCAEAIISGLWTTRPDGKEAIDACLAARRDGLAGIDFIPTPYDREAAWAEWDEAYRWAERAAGAGLGVTIHAGEFSPANVHRALSLPGLARIGHAVHAAFSTALLDELGESGVTVECCLTSNEVLGAVPSLERHPIRTLVAAGIPVTLSSDDPVGLCTTIGREYELAAGLGFEASDLLGFTCNGIQASFASAERKGALLSQIAKDDV